MIFKIEDDQDVGNLRARASGEIPGVIPVETGIRFCWIHKKKTRDPIMLISEMTDTECRQFLSRSTFGRLACARGNQPYVVPIYFVYEPDHLYGFSTFGKKIEWMRLNPLVCVEIDEVPNHFRWTSLIVSGRYEEFPDKPECRTERDHAQMLLEKRFLWWQTAHAAMQLRSRKERHPPLFYCIHIEDLTGRKAIPDSVEARVGFENDPRVKY